MEDKAKQGIQITLVEADTFPHLTGNSILETLEANGIEAPYHCRDGFCGACRCKLLEGEVDYKVDPLAFIDDDEILTCCSIPLTHIKISL